MQSIMTRTAASHFISIEYSKHLRHTHFHLNPKTKTVLGAEFMNTVVNFEFCKL